MGMVSNGSFLGGGFHFATRTDVTDGLPDFIIIQNSELQDPTEINKHKKR
jgi:diacylglycerol kinase family enzyme